jgi:uncharacterized protein YkwD
MVRLPILAAISACACAIALAPVAAAADDPYAPLLAPSGTCGATADRLGLDQASAAVAMLCLTNYARAQEGLVPLRLNPALDAAGNAKLDADLSCGEFSHTPCGQPFDSVFADYVSGATSFEIGENIAWGTGSFGTPRETMNGWLHSDAHRENLLNASYRELGVGYAPDRTFQGYAGATLWAQEFGTAARPAAAPAPEASSTKQRPLARHKPRRLRVKLSR